MRKLRIPENLTAMAYRSIREYILEGRLDERSRLTEEFLSKQLGISKSPIREALNRLETEGLIRIAPRRGAYLRSFTTKEIYDLYDLREALEVHAVATATLTAKLIEQLGRSVERMERALNANDKARYIEEDVNFHRLIAESTGNERLAITLENLQQQVWLFRRKTYDLSRSNAAAAHAAVVKALAKGDKNRARQLMRDHISDTCQRLVAFLQESPTRARAAS